MDKPKMAGTKSIRCDLEAGKKYAYCTCGESANQPFCDGQHSGSSFKPQIFELAETKQVALCSCKQTANPPYCDGAHKTCAPTE